MCSTIICMLTKIIGANDHEGVVKTTWARKKESIVALEAALLAYFSCFENKCQRHKNIHDLSKYCDDTM